MRRATNIIMPVIVLIGILALLLASGSGCGGKPAPSMTVYYQIGQPVETSRQILTVVSADKTDRYNVGGLTSILYTYVYAPPTTVFIIAEVTVTNVGQGALAISRNDFSLKDSAGRVWPSIGYKGLDAYPGKKLSSGQTAYGHIAFEVPEIAAGLELSCVLQGLSPVLGVWQLPW
jgi:hypothetical protein